MPQLHCAACSAPPLPKSPPQGHQLRQRLQELRRGDPGAHLPEAEWHEWLGLGAQLRDLGEVLPLDAQDWFAVSLDRGRA